MRVWMCELTATSSPSSRYYTMMSSHGMSGENLAVMENADEDPNEEGVQISAKKAATSQDLLKFMLIDVDKKIEEGKLTPEDIKYFKDVWDEAKDTPAARTELLNYITRTGEEGLLGKVIGGDAETFKELLDTAINSLPSSITTQGRLVGYLTENQDLLNAVIGTDTDKAKNFMELLSTAKDNPDAQGKLLGYLIEQYNSVNSDNKNLLKAVIGEGTDKAENFMKLWDAANNNSAARENLVKYLTDSQDLLNAVIDRNGNKTENFMELWDATNNNSAARENLVKYLTDSQDLLNAVIDRNENKAANFMELWDVAKNNLATQEKLVEKYEGSLLGNIGVHKIKELYEATKNLDLLGCVRSELNELYNNPPNPPNAISLKIFGIVGKDLSQANFGDNGRVDGKGHTTGGWALGLVTGEDEAGGIEGVITAEEFLTWHNSDIDEFIRDIVTLFGDDALAALVTMSKHLGGEAEKKLLDRLMTFYDNPGVTNVRDPHFASAHITQQIADGINKASEDGEPDFIALQLVSKMNDNQLTKLLVFMYQCSGNSGQSVVNTILKMTGQESPTSDVGNRLLHQALELYSDTDDRRNGAHPIVGKAITDAINVIIAGGNEGAYKDEYKNLCDYFSRPENSAQLRKVVRHCIDIDIPKDKGDTNGDTTEAQAVRKLLLDDRTQRATLGFLDEAYDQTGGRIWDSDVKDFLRTCKNDSAIKDDNPALAKALDTVTNPANRARMRAGLPPAREKSTTPEQINGGTGGLHVAAPAATPAPVRTKDEIKLENEARVSDIFYKGFTEEDFKALKDNGINLGLDYKAFIKMASTQFSQFEFRATGGGDAQKKVVTDFLTAYAKALSHGDTDNGKTAMREAVMLLTDHGFTKAFLEAYTSANYIAGFFDKGSPHAGEQYKADGTTNTQAKSYHYIGSGSTRAAVDAFHDWAKNNGGDIGSGAESSYMKAIKGGTPVFEGATFLGIDVTLNGIKLRIRPDDAVISKISGDVEGEAWKDALLTELRRETRTENIGFTLTIPNEQDGIVENKAPQLDLP
ncbi:hypothetical protein NO2_0038 [Candidatus Termititenax persephonae]|uniref:Uncharacterized protein n=1 Tax=Candidatus Termititenax persephonae TaxID=2218525 RepID=A0A388TEA0_9BACT|nr:hypothetical protein NO2_0038 [Candidatus Termititenax persephonae]